MKSIFDNAPYGRYDMHRYGYPAMHPTAGISKRMGQGVISDVLQALGISEGDVTGLLNALPLEKQGAYKIALDECKAKGVTTVAGAKCLYDLYQQIKDDVEGNKDNPTTTPVVAPASSSFPIIPVAIGVVGLGLIIAIVAA